MAVIILTLMLILGIPNVLSAIGCLFRTLVLHCAWQFISNGCGIFFSNASKRN